MEENNNNNLSDNITFMIEIARDLINQGREKMTQIDNYIKVITVMNFISNNYLFLPFSSEYQNIIKDYKCSSKTQKILALITDGNFNNLKYIIEKILTPLLDTYSKDNNISLDNKAISDIKVNIQSTVVKIDNYDKIVNKESFVNDIFDNFILFYNLRINKVKHFLLYIGEISEFSRIKELLINLKCNKDKEKYIEGLLQKLVENENKFAEFNKVFISLKKYIKEFEKQLKSLIKKEYKDINKIYEEKKFDNMIYNIISNHKKFINTIKVKLNLKGEVYIFFDKNDNDEYKDKTIQFIKEHDSFKKMKKIMELQFKVKEFNDITKIFDYGNIVPSTLFFFVLKEQQFSYLFKLSLKKPDKEGKGNIFYVGIEKKKTNEKNENDNEKNENDNEKNENDNEKNENDNKIKEKDNKIKEKGNKIKEKDNKIKEKDIQIKEKDSEIQLSFYNLEKKDFNFDYQIQTFIKDKINKIKYDFDKDEMLDEKNIQKKLEGDLQILFEDKTLVFNIGEIINNYNKDFNINNINNLKKKI